MSGLLWFWIAIAGGIGAATRFAVDEAVMRWLHSSGRASGPDGKVGHGILVVNVSGSLLLGLLIGPLSLVVWSPVVIVGFLGGYTTFSSASLISIQLGLREGIYKGASYALLTYLLSVTAVVFGLIVGTYFVAPG